MRVMNRWVQAVVLVVLSATGHEALGSNGVIEINQVKALAGGITAGDTADFPVTISASGSYRLTSNLDVRHQVDPTGILITANDVTIDMNGFWIIGSARCTTTCGQDSCTMSCGQAGTGVGIDSTPPGLSHSTGVKVVNGGVRGMRGFGIELGSQHHVEKVQVLSNAGGGIELGRDGVVRDTTASFNGGHGFWTGGVIESCTAYGNKSSGFTAYATIRNSVSRENLGVGIQLSSGVALGNSIRDNASFGLSATTGAGYAQNVLGGNNGAGAEVTGGIQIGTNICNTAVCP